MRGTLIAWCDDTHNLWWGCVEVNPQCDHCYAKALDERFSGGHWGAHVSRLMISSVWESLRKTQKEAALLNQKRTQFIQSMGDIFERATPLVNRDGEVIPDMDTADLRNRLFQSVIPNSPNLIFLLLTKRPQNIEHMVPHEWLSKPPSNVWYGCSVGTGNKTLDQHNIDALVSVPGNHFLSAEPLLGPLDADIRGVRWVITGGESGAKARPARLQWFRQIRDVCAMTNVPFFMKQYGSVLAKEFGFADRKGESASEWHNDLQVQQFPVW